MGPSGSLYGSAKGVKIEIEIEVDIVNVEIEVVSAQVLDLG